MIPMIQTALTYGYTATQILKYVSNKFKNIAPNITKAQQSGYSDEDILKFLSNKVKPKNQKAVNQELSAQERYMKSVGLKSKEEKAETRNKFISGALGLGAGALSAYNIYQNYGGLLKDLGQSLGIGETKPPSPGGPINPPENVSQTPGQMATPKTPMPGPNIGMQVQQSVESPINQAMQPESPGTIAQAAKAIQPQQPTSIFEQITQGVDLSSLSPQTVQQLNFLSMISDQLQSQGKTLADPQFKKLAKKIQDTISGKPGTVLEEVSRVFNKDQPKNIEKSAIVSTPQGVGEVKGISNGKAIVEINGKAHKIDENEIETPPIPEKDLADLHNDLIAGIEKSTGKQVSRNVNWAGYDPEAKELAYRPWNGEQYIYDNIEPEDVKILTDLLTQRKTTGENFIGAWEEGTESPIGAAMHKLVQKLKERAKGTGQKEYARKYQTVYSAYEPAEKEAKLKKKLKEQEERKRQKNEAKKAK